MLAKHGGVLCANLPVLIVNAEDHFAGLDDGHDLCGGLKTGARGYDLCCSPRRAVSAFISIDGW